MRGVDGLVDFFVSLVAAHLADGVLEHDVLLEEVVYGHLVDGVVVLRALEEEAEEALCAPASGTCGQVAQQDEVETEGGGQDGVAAEEVDLDLHGVVHPAEDVDVVPAFLVVVAGRVIVDAYLVIVSVVVVAFAAAVDAVEVGLLVGHEDGLEGRELGDFLGAEVGGFVEHETVAVAEDVG